MSRTPQSSLSQQIGLRNWNLVHAFKVARCESNISFLRWCRNNSVVPKGLCVSNKLKHTMSVCQSACNVLVKKQSQQWLKMAIDCNYVLLDQLKTHKCFPLTESDNSVFDNYKCMLRAVKHHKRKALSSRYNLSARDSVIDPPKGFTNLSTAVWSKRELSVLNKGPSYIPPLKKKQSFASAIDEKSEIQCCYDRLLWKSPAIARSSNVVEFLSGCVRLNSQYRQRGSSQRDKEICQAVSSIKKKCRDEDRTIVPSDKTKRLIALNQTTYDEILTGSLNHEDTTVRSVHPKTIQSAFNRIIDRISNQYDNNSSIYTEISSCKTSEPLPSHPYSLPKDHKEGPLKGRPIISTVNSVIRKLAQFITKILSPLVKEYIPAHIESSVEFKQFIENVHCGENESFFSLDVKNLYGSIPLADDNNSNGLVTVVSKFFSDHHGQSAYSDLQPRHFQELVTICLKEDRYILNNNSRKQINGIAMGNPAAPPFAIIYMDYVEKCILHSNKTIRIWKRYIDDCFVLSSSTPRDVLNSCNQINPSVQFTLEESTNNVLPFLDMNIILSNNNFTTSLHIKPLHSGTYLPFDSFCPADRKRSLVRGELLRSRRNSSKPNERSSEELIHQRLYNNKYPVDFVNSISSQLNNNRHTEQDYISFIRLPYLGEGHLKSIRRLLHQSGLNSSIRVIFSTSKPLSHQFRPPQQEQQCKPTCISCKCAVVKGKCLRKCVVYKIECLHCDKIYIGETHRTINSRIKEHIGEDKKSKVYQHLLNCCNPSTSNIRWKILGHYSGRNKRLAAEAFHQKKEHLNLMDGCESKIVLSFLS